MMTFCRYASAVAVLVVASLTPTSCSDVSEPALAFEQENEEELPEDVARPITEDVAAQIYQGVAGPSYYDVEVFDEESAGSGEEDSKHSGS